MYSKKHQNRYITTRVESIHEYLWSQIAIDFYGLLPSDEKLFVLMDMNSRYPRMEVMKNTSVQSGIRKFNKLLSMFGYPEKVLMNYHNGQWTTI